MSMKKLGLLAACLLLAALPALAQTTGDYRSVASGNWDAAATWETYNGATWDAASVKPGATNNVYLQAGFIVTLTGNEACLNYAMHNAAADSIVLGANTLSVNGSIAQFSSAAGTFPVTYSTTANQKISTALGGKISVVGNSRTVFNTGQWSANPQRWNLDISMNPSQICSSATNLKAGHLTVTSGTLFVNGALRPDSVLAPSGSFLIAAGAAAIVTGKISRVTSASSPCALIDINGTLQASGDSIAATNINVNDGGIFVCLRSNGNAINGLLTYNNGSILKYAGSSAQTSRGELTASVYELEIDNPGGVLLNSAANVTYSLIMDNGLLNNSAYNITLAANRYLYRYNGSLSVAPVFAGPCYMLYFGDYDITTGPELPTVTAIPAMYVDKGSHRLTINRSVTMGMLHMGGGEIYTPDTVFVTDGSPIDYGAGWVNGYLSLKAETGATTKFFPVGSNNGYSPVTVAFNNVSSPGMLTAKAVQAPEPHALYPDSVLQRYWTVKDDGALTFDYYNPSFTYQPGDFTPNFTEAGDESTMIATMYDGYWIFPIIDVRDTVNNTATLQNITWFSNFTFGKGTDAFVTPDTTRPTIVWTDPADGDSGVALNAPIIFAFSEPMDTASVNGNSSPSISNTGKGWNAGLDTMTLTSDLMTSGTTYHLALTAGKDLAGNDLVGLPDSLIFTTVANQGPVITVVELPQDTYDAPQTLIAKALITDPAKAGITSAQLAYAFTGSGAWYGIAGTRIGVTDTFQFDLSGSYSPGTVIDYFFLAYDDQDSETREPAGRYHNYRVRVLSPIAPTNLRVTSVTGAAVDSLFWTAPAESLWYNNPGGSDYHYPMGAVLTTRFTPMYDNCKLERITSLWEVSGYDSVRVHVYADDGTGLPDTATELVTPFNIKVSSYPNYTNADLSGLPVYPGGDFHVGYEYLADHAPFAVVSTNPQAPTRSLWDSAGTWVKPYNGGGWTSAAVVSYSSYIKKGAKNVGGYEIWKQDGTWSLLTTSYETWLADNAVVVGNSYQYNIRALYPRPSLTDTFSYYTGPVSITTTVSGLPVLSEYRFYLAAACPNPVKGPSEFKFGLAKEQQAGLGIYNVLGQRVKTLVNGRLAAGNHSVKWNGCDESGRKVSSGIYVYRLTAGENTSVKRFTLIR